MFWEKNVFSYILYKCCNNKTKHDHERPKQAVEIDMKLNSFIALIGKQTSMKKHAMLYSIYRLHLKSTPFGCAFKVNEQSLILREAAATECLTVQLYAHFKWRVH